MRSTSQASRYRGRKGGYANPFFPKKKKIPKKRKSSQKFIFIPLIALALFFAFSEYPKLHITDIKIEGAQLIDEAKVGETVQSALAGRRSWGLVRNNNTALLSKQNIKEKLFTTLPIKDVSVDRKGFNTITVTIGERLPIFRLDYPPTHFSVIDEDGLVVFAEIGTEVVVPVETVEEESSDDDEDVVNNEATTEEPPTTSVVECIFCDTFDNLTLITVSSTPPTFFKTGTSTLPKSKVSSLQTILTRFESLTIPVDNFTITEEAPETVQIRTLEGFLVYIDLSKDLDAQIANLGALLDREYPNPPRGLQYIDVRYGNRLYYQ